MSFRRNPPFLRLLAAQTVSPLGDAMGTLALIVHVQRTNGTGTAVGLLLLAEFVPFLASPVLGSFADRGDARRVMAFCEVAQGAVIGVAALFLPALPVLFALLLVRGSLAAAFLPASRVGVPSLVNDSDLSAANGLLGALREAGSLAGPVVAGVLIPVIGVRGVLAIDAVTFLVAVPLLLRLPPLLAGRDDEPTGLLTDARAGVREVFSSRITGTLAVGFWLVVLVTGADDIVLPFLARDVFGAGPRGIGVLAGAASAGLLVGMLATGAITRRAGGVRTLLLGMLVTSTGNLLTGAAPALAAAIGMQVVRGIGIAWFDTNVQTLLQREVPRAARGRVIANVYGGVGIMGALSYAIGGPLLDATSPKSMFLMMGTAGLATTIVTGVRLRRSGSPEAPTTRAR